MEIRKAEIRELAEIMPIYDCARQFMAGNGNPGQWINGYPQEEVILEDIKAGNFYVCANEGGIIGVFTFFVGEEPNYQRIDQGDWHRDGAYGTIHRVASDGSMRGLAAKIFAFCEERCAYLRIDTHEKNIPMQGALKKFGFQKCGIVYMQDGTERIAFDYVKGNEQIPELIYRAFEARKRAYAPYSGFQVGAALLCGDGSIYEGCNIENASYGACNCAERTAIFQAVYEKKRDFRAIAIVGVHKDAETFEYCAPCGICRQVMAEFCDPEDFWIILPKSRDDYKVYTLKELLPLSFAL